jgi:hypothetical protein
MAGTHPDIASLVDPLFAVRKEGCCFPMAFSLIYPLSAEGEEGGPA